MAFECTMTATYRMACDRCGTTAITWHQTFQDAIEAGEREGFKDASWTERNCRMQSWLCGKCAKRRAKQARDAGVES